jgi:membrane protease YdiL (CAAX protease family)
MTRSTGATRRQLGLEVVLVLGVSYGASGIQSALDLIKSVAATPIPLSQQVATTFYRQADPHAWLDIAYQSLAIVTGLVPVVLVAYLLVRTGESLATVGVDADQPASDARWGVALALVIGSVGLGFRVAANALGINLQLTIGTTGQWWQLVILVVQSAVAAVGEELIVLAFLLHRFAQLGWSDRKAITVSALVRGSYHLYQGFGGGVANMAMGLVFGWLYKRRGRVLPFVVAHFLIDVVATIGYVELHNRIHWLH